MKTFFGYIVGGAVFGFWALLSILVLVGWLKCVVYFVRSDFQPPYKAEIVYGLGAFTGAGAIIGWIDIDD